MEAHQTDRKGREGGWVSVVKRSKAQMGEWAERERGVHIWARIIGTMGKRGEPGLGDRVRVGWAEGLVDRDRKKLTSRMTG